MNYIKPTCAVNVLHKRYEQSGFHFLILFFEHGKELESFIFCGFKVQIFGGEKDIVSVAYFTVFGFLAYLLFITNS